MIGCLTETANNKTEDFKNEKLFQVLVEIPSGTIQKWEWNKKTNTIERDSVNGKARVINYLNYPFNYGIVINKEYSNDGDPLDAVIIGDPLKRGEVLNVKVLTILATKDKGKEDNKVVFLHKSSPIYSNVNDLNDMKKLYPGILEIIKLWFKNYKPNSITLDYSSTNSAIKELDNKTLD